MACDDPVSALDLSVPAQVLNLLKDMKAQLGLSFVFINCALADLLQIADRICVITDGKMVEEDTVDDVLNTPPHPHTRCLLNSRPTLV